ncbi:MAG: RNA-binding protein [Spirochaetales bacterium]|jgi:RNA recognition motif-containing protein|nr:RNA-binding protein [Spirochaetales bacterium]MDX9800419.1 RNA-binding protein [Spirochaetia bacterium]
MSKKLYVGNLNYATTEDQLADLFAEYGNVLDVSIVIDRYTNRSKGFGFVEMEDGTAASEAIAALNGKQFNNRELLVNEARERAPRERSYRN